MSPIADYASHGAIYMVSILSVGRSGDGGIAQLADAPADSVFVEEDLVSPDDDVEFVGPEGPVLQWPDQGERGAVESVSADMVRVVWERSPLFVAWPLNWVKRSPRTSKHD